MEKPTQERVWVRPHRLQVLLRSKLALDCSFRSEEVLLSAPYLSMSPLLGALCHFPFPSALPAPNHGHRNLFCNSSSGVAVASCRIPRYRPSVPSCKLPWLGHLPSLTWPSPELPSSLGVLFSSDIILALGYCWPRRTHRKWHCVAL